MHPAVCVDTVAAPTFIAVKSLLVWFAVYTKFVAEFMLNSQEAYLWEMLPQRCIIRAVDLRNNIRNLRHINHVRGRINA